MHLRSISMKGFKSFPQRTKLEFGTGVSVIVGPNGSGKSNITDAVLWALGEQSPLAVRGQSMKDVIFAGAHGVQGSNAAEVEVVIDNHDGALDIDFSEISIVRRLERDGEGEYRLNGARCRLVDVVEVLSDSGLGKEMHSVVSQGKVEQIVLSRPRERRLLIEEAAGLGKHRKRRRRAQLKLERTEENLSRALDVEREARSRLRPLKRQAEAAELHERLERQTLEARYSLARDAARSARLALSEAEERARSVRAERDEAERLLGEVARRREEAEDAFATQTRDRERLQARLYAARSASERISMRLERVREQAEAARERRERRLRQLEVLEQRAVADADLSSEEERPEDRITRDRARAGDSRRRPRGAARGRGCRPRGGARRRACPSGGARAGRYRAARGAGGGGAGGRRGAQRAPRGRARRGGRAREGGPGGRRTRGGEPVRAQCHRAARRGRSSGGAPDADAARPLAERLHVEAGYELALAAVLGPRLTAAVVNDRSEGERVLDAAGDNGAAVLLRVPIWDPSQDGPAAGAVPASPSVPGGQQLAQLVRPERDVAALAERLLVGVWVVESLSALPDTFSGIAVTRAGRLFDARTGELAQAPAGGAERLLEELAKRDELVALSEQAVRDEIRGPQRAGATGRRRRRGGYRPRGRRERAAHGAARGGRRRGGREPLRVGDRPPPRGARRRARGGAASRAAGRPARRAQARGAHRARA